MVYGLYEPILAMDYHGNFYLVVVVQEHPMGLLFINSCLPIVLLGHVVLCNETLMIWNACPHPLNNATTIARYPLY